MLGLVVPGGGRTCGGRAPARLPRAPQRRREAVSAGERVGGGCGGAATAPHRALLALLRLDGGCALRRWKEGARGAEGRRGAGVASVRRVWPRLDICSSCGLGFGGHRSRVRSPELAGWEAATARGLTCYRCPHTAPEAERESLVPASPEGLGLVLLPVSPQVTSAVGKAYLSQMSGLLAWVCSISQLCLYG